jgi:hypothetical protein
MNTTEKIMGFSSWNRRSKPSFPSSMIEPTFAKMNEDNEKKKEKKDPEKIVEYIDKKEKETEEYLAEKRRLNRLIRRNVQIIKYQLANWDFIKKIRKKYHKKGRLSAKRKRFSRK